MYERNSIHETSILTNCILGDDIVVWPFCFLDDVTLGNGVKIEGNARIEKSTLHDTVQVLWGSVIRESTLEAWCIIGCEVKKSHLGPQTKAKHPGTSIISTQTGTKVNFGGGAKCANYDGKWKWNFILGDNVFIGCNSVLSVKANQTTHIHTGTKIGANIHVSSDIPPHSLIYTDRETWKTTVREGYYASQWKINN